MSIYGSYWVFCNYPYMSVCVLRDIQLVRELLFSNCWRGLGCEPDGLRSWNRPADSAEPSRGALPQRLDVAVCQHAQPRRRGRLPSRPLLKVCWWIKHVVIWKYLACPRHLNFFYSEIALLYCVNEHSCFLTGCLFCIYLHSYVWFQDVLFLYCIFLNNLTCGNSFCVVWIQYIFSVEIYLHRFNRLMQKMHHFQRGVHTMFTVQIQLEC